VIRVRPGEKKIATLNSFISVLSLVYSKEAKYTAAVLQSHLCRVQDNVVLT